MLLGRDRHENAAIKKGVASWFAKENSEAGLTGMNINQGIVQTAQVESKSPALPIT